MRAALTTERNRPVGVRVPRSTARATVAGLGLLGGVLIFALWLRAGGVTDVHSTADGLTSAGRLTALLGAYLALVAVLLLARVPLLEQVAGFDRLAGWHRLAARTCLTM
jgi:Na+/H+ antiporter NhaB